MGATAKKQTPEELAEKAAQKAVAGALKGLRETFGRVADAFERVADAMENRGDTAHHVDAKALPLEHRIHSEPL